MIDWRTQAKTADEAVSAIQSGMRIFIHGAAATPVTLLDALARRRDLTNVTLYHLHTEGEMAFAAPEHQESIPMRLQRYREKELGRWVSKATAGRCRSHAR